MPQRMDLPLESPGTLPRQKNRAPLWLWAAALSLGLIQSWANRFYMGNDGVSYLDMADAYLKGFWHLAINSSWNPLYAWLIALDFKAFHPNAYWEYPAVQLLNFGIYCLTLACFEYLLRGWLLLCRPTDPMAIRILGYAAFIWSSLFLIGIWTTNADMLIAACFYAALGLVLHAKSGSISPLKMSIFLGAVLAAGYYSKAAMFPISLMMILIVAFVLRWRDALITGATFALLTLPFIAVLSKATGHLTIGDTARVNYAWYVDGIPPRWWQGGPQRAGQPLHPPQIVLDSPRVYAYGDTFASVTYPLWYDFAYWYKGVRIWLAPRRLIREMLADTAWIVGRLLREGGGFVVGLAYCLWRLKGRSRITLVARATWPAWVLSIAAILLYNIVHVETRYVGAFATVILLTAFTALDVNGRLLAGAVAVFGFMWTIVFVPPPTTGARYWPTRGEGTNVPWEVATNMYQMGLRANDKVASVGYANRADVFWARLARAHIVVEPDWSVNFWSLSESDRQKTLDAMRHTGAFVAVSDSTPPDSTDAAGWQEVGKTGFYAFLLSTAPGPAPAH